jgi:poly(A) polymerase
MGAEMAHSEGKPEALARRIVRRLRAHRHEAWLVGGCVRDLLLGLAPKDFDVATSAPPGRLLELFPGSGEVGAHFGVVLVREGAAQVEVSTFRSDGLYLDGRRPSEVRFESSPRADVLRRDFTINGLLLDPETGEVLDFVGGRADLEARLLRAIGDPVERFQEDHLRLLRAIRFAARLGFVIEPATMRAIGACHAAIASVAAERVRDELVRILTEGGARRGIELLAESGLLEDVLPEVAALRGVAQPPEFHPEGDVWTHTLLMLEAMGRPSPALALGTLLHDIGKPRTFRIEDRIRFNGHDAVGARMAEAVLDRLRFPRETARQVEALVAQHMRFIGVRRMKASTLKRFLRAPGFADLLELHRLDALASNGDLEAYEFARQALEAMPPEQLHPARLITGDDLLAAGYPRGPLLATILTAVEDAQLEGTVTTHEEALRFVRGRFTLPSPPES